MIDIICGIVGGLILVILIYLFVKGKYNKFLSIIIKEIIDWIKFIGYLNKVCENE